MNSLSDAKEFHDPETASSSGLSHVPSQPMSVPSPKGTRSRDSGSPHNTRNSSGRSGHVFEDLPAQEGPFPAFFENPRNLAASSCGQRSGNTGNTLKHGEGLRREPKSSATPTPRFSMTYETWDPSYRTRNIALKNCVMELHFGKFPDSNDFQCWRVNFKTQVCANTPFHQLTMS